MRNKVIIAILILTCLLISCTTKQNNDLNTEVNKLESNNIVNNLNYAASISEGDVLIYNITGKYVLNIAGKVSNLPENVKNIRTNQVFLSQDFHKVYFNTDFSNDLGRLFVYDLKSRKCYDLLDNLGINIEGYISTFSYKDDKIIAILGKMFKNSATNIEEKKDTNLMLEIDLSNNTYEIIELSFVPQGISIYSGLCFIGENILMCQSGYLCNEEETQCIIEIDKKGNLINKYDIYEEQGIYNIQISPDNKKISYQVGQTPVDLYVYDIEKNIKLEIFNSNATNMYSYCIYSVWSKKDNYIYYITLDYNNNSPSKTNSYNLHKHEFK